VISRYPRIAGYDWIAVPAVGLPVRCGSGRGRTGSADAMAVSQLRDSYRRSPLQDLVPDAPGGGPPKGDWIQLAGAAYDRNIYGLSLETTSEEDERLIQLSTRCLTSSVSISCTATALTLRAASSTSTIRARCGEASSPTRGFRRPSSLPKRWSAMPDAGPTCVFRAS
jgi:hypothetical protein